MKRSTTAIVATEIRQSFKQRYHEICKKALENPPEQKQF